MKVNLTCCNKNKKLIWGIVIIILLTAYIFCLPHRLFTTPYSTVVVDRHQQLLGARIAADNQWRFPACDTVPDRFATCIIAFEDRHFHSHPGVNPLAIGRAMIQNIKNRRVVSGGSTITMQVIRLSRNQPRTWWEKCIEIILATRLEWSYSKEEILAMYASHAPFGGNVVGLEAAAWRYYGHPAANLSWAEAATLSVLPNAPAMIHLSKNRNQLLKKRNQLLSYLKEKGTLSASQYDLSLNEALPAAPLPLPLIAPHLVTDYSKTSPGQFIKSTIDKSVQQHIELLLERWNTEFMQSDIKNIAAIVIEISSNQVLAYCGNVHFDQSNSGNQVNVITSPRSTGSILKPFLYCAMLQEGELLPNTLLPDIPLNINGFTPQNFNFQYDGAVPAAEVLYRSLNVPSVFALRQYSVPKFYSFLKNIGLTTLNKPASHYGLSLILGGAEATLEDLAFAYSDMARSLAGLHNNNIFDAGAVWHTFEALKEVNRPEEIDWKYIPSIQNIAWKTGTSYGFRDAWSIGVTPRYVVGVWVGNASGEGKAGIVGARTAGPVMFDIFNILPSSRWFRRPDNSFVEAEVCHESGYLKGLNCEHIDTVLICPSGSKSASCPYHHTIYLSEDGLYRVSQACAGNTAMQRASWFVLPPAWEWYYKQQHPSYRSLPPWKAGCGTDGSFRPMQFIYPQQSARISLPKQLDGRPGEMVLDLAHSESDAVVHWHLDNEFIGTSEFIHKMSIMPPPGKHSVTVVDNEGNTLSIGIEVL